MARMSKLDRMNLAESALADVDASDLKDIWQQAADAAEKFEESRQEAEQALGEAGSYHEERDWESRNDSLDSAQTAVESMREALEEFDNVAEFVVVPDGRREQFDTLVGEIQEHLDNLIEM